MRALFVTPECYPLVKTGGLADVTGALPLALVAEGVESRVVLPAYPGIVDQLDRVQVVSPLPDLFGGAGRLLAGTASTGLAVLAVEAPHLYGRAGGIYLGPDGTDWPDNDLRFAALSWVGALVAAGRLALGGWRPDLVHAHDWQAGLVPAYLRLGVVTGPDRHMPPTLLTIHNLAFQGLFPAARLTRVRLPVGAYDVDGVEYYEQISFLKAGVRYADHVSTVSPTYAREILTVAQGMGFDGVLRTQTGEVTGIVNGIDDDVWDPWNDTHLVAPYSARQMKGKAADKAALQRELGLAVDPGAPLFCVVSRLTEQKGLDLLLTALPDLLAVGAQLAVLGTGAADLEAGFLAAATARPESVAAVIGYDEALSHRMQSGADAIVVPSRFEPCGLTQLYGLRYGTLPVVARVGGLADTVIDANPAAVGDGVATGFVFSPVDAVALADAIGRAVAAFRDAKQWATMQRRAMTRDVSWRRAATRYAELYRQLVGALAPPHFLTAPGSPKP